MVTRRTTIPILLALCLAVTGCSAPQSVAYDTFTGTPPGFDGAGGLLNGSPGAIWISGRRQFAIVTFGSSSCPPVPTSISSSDSSHIAITFVPSPNSPCTADLTATTHKFTLPKDVDAAADVTVDVTMHFDTEYRYELRLPGT